MDGGECSGVRFTLGRPRIGECCVSGPLSRSSSISSHLVLSVAHASGEVQGLGSPIIEGNHQLTTLYGKANNRVAHSPYGLLRRRYCIGVPCPMDTIREQHSRRSTVPHAVSVGVAPCRLGLVEDVSAQTSGCFIVGNVGRIGRVFDHGNGDVGQETCYLGGLLGAIIQPKGSGQLWYIKALQPLVDAPGVECHNGQVFGP